MEHFHRAEPSDHGELGCQAGLGPKPCRPVLTPTGPQDRPLVQGCPQVHRRDARIRPSLRHDTVTVQRLQQMIQCQPEFAFHVLSTFTLEL